MKFDFTSIMNRHGMDAIAVEAPGMPGSSIGGPREGFEQVDTLREMHLDVPHMTDLAQDLRAEGMPLPKGILTVDEMTEEVCKLLCRSK